MKRLIRPTLMALTLAACSSPTPTAPSYAIETTQLGPNPCRAQAEIPTQQCEALVGLYRATGGTGWTTRTNWLETTSPCTWYGVTCDGGGVTSIGFYSNNLSGRLPEGLGRLANLQSLQLVGNPLTGPIPASLGALKSLQTLILSVSQLTGPIPASLGNLRSLTYLSLEYNNLNGRIPESLGNLANLQTLNLPVNQLTGRIPASLGRLASLQQLSLGSNQLSGPIPATFGNLGNLQYFVLTGNQLTGTIPASLGNLENLNYLRLDWNQLTGIVPLSVAIRGGIIQGSFGGCSLLGNLGLQIPDQPQYRAADLDADGEICHLPFTAIATANAP